jgi:hypothetical protein
VPVPIPAMARARYPSAARLGFLTDNYGECIMSCRAWQGRATPRQRRLTCGARPEQT